jgi:hypothetical protein
MIQHIDKEIQQSINSIRNKTAHIPMKFGYSYTRTIISVLGQNGTVYQVRTGYDQTNNYIRSYDPKWQLITSFKP